MEMSLGLIPMDLLNADIAMLSSFPSGRNTPRTKKMQAVTVQPQRQPPPFGYFSSTRPLLCSSTLLNGGLVRQRGDGLRRVVGQGNGSRLTGHKGLALDLNGGAVGGSLLLGLGVGLDAADEVLS